jgi:hypothetical protein
MALALLVGLGFIAWAIHDGCVVIARALQSNKD